MKIMTLGIALICIAVFSGRVYSQDTTKRNTSTKINPERENAMYGNSNSDQADSVSGNRESTRPDGMPEKSSVTSPEKNMKVPKESRQPDRRTNRNAIDR